MNAQAATRQVKQYFEETNGDAGSVAFQVESVERNDVDGAETWVVICSFFRSMHARERSTFSVRVSASGDILQVTPLTPSSAATPSP
jgi:hypothetical protein